MITQGKNKDPMPSILCQVKKKALQRYIETFSKYFKTYDDLINQVIKSKLQLD